jgi:hypothetical protein
MTERLDKVSAQKISGYDEVRCTAVGWERPAQNWYGIVTGDELKLSQREKESIRGTHFEPFERAVFFFAPDFTEM